MANQRVHLIANGESPAHFMYPKNQQSYSKLSANMMYPKVSRSESRIDNVQVAGTINTSVKHVGFGNYNNCMSYISFVSNITGYSKAIPLRPSIGPKGGRPRKLQTGKLLVPKKKRLKKRQSSSSVDNDEDCRISGVEGAETATTIVTATSVTEALNVIEKRKKSIRAKLLFKRENLLTKEEEQDIHTRADIYAMTTLPYPDFYILPEDDPLPQPPLRQEDVHVVTSYPPPRRKRRRNYGTTNCYVNHHNDEDAFDNTKMLPLGTRLLKPPTKLVELVAHAINGSPDGLLQVQQIYTYLQNKYPFYRYMERVAINSWRSSIRHALYQKWFRKIRFDLSYISSKGCYWAINHKTSPKEWSMPDGNLVSGGCPILDDVRLEDGLHASVSSLLGEVEGSESCDQEDILVLAKEFGISVPDSDSIDDETGIVDHHVPQPVREPDPILATCGLDWSTDDFYLSSDDWGCNSLGSSNPSSLESPTFAQEPEDLPESIISNPIQSITFLQDGIKTESTTYSDSSEYRNSNAASQKQKMCPFSPLINWTPNWEEYGAYILSPQNATSLRCLNSGLQGDCLNGRDETDDYTPMEDITSVQELYDDIENLCSDFYNSDSSDITSPDDLIGV